nr:hypothetical protein [Paraburkholderia sp. PGU19]
MTPNRSQKGFAGACVSRNRMAWAFRLPLELIPRRAGRPSFIKVVEPRSQRFVQSLGERAVDGLVELATVASLSWLRAWLAMRKSEASGGSS